MVVFIGRNPALAKHPFDAINWALYGPGIRKTLKDKGQILDYVNSALREAANQNHTGSDVSNAVSNMTEVNTTLPKQCS